MKIVEKIKLKIVIFTGMKFAVYCMDVFRNDARLTESKQLFSIRRSLLYLN